MIDGLTAQAVLAATCLAVVLLLILGAARAARHFSAGQRPAIAGLPVAILGTIALDRTHRLHVVELSGQRTLVLTGGAGALLALAPAK